ncbi:hypothetical protein ElyMa_005424600 [Elysia marginata]|uniref:Uncharacterized protein n=1 Tax=Elysia marginata TaxID=1093978 RepID=A0AAV4EJC9_9GAST|nr:hypothetical protein ElyMa_005424600 [Elysia marginata]
MQHVQAIQNHPHRDWILAGLGAATLLGVYVCYRCCCRRSNKNKKKVSDEAPKLNFASKDRFISSHSLAPHSAIYGEDKRETESVTSEHPQPDIQKSKTKAAEVTADEGKNSKPYNDANKYLPQRVHPPPNLVCPPARVGISLFMDSRPTAWNPHILSNARSYHRDRWYRGTYSRLSPPSPAFIRASQYPLKRPIRSGKMPQAANTGFK